MNPFLGVFFHWLGGFASGSFYVPYRFVMKWAWETAWMVGGFFSWIIMPSLLALLMTRDLHGVIARQGGGTLAWTYLFGCLWGLGGLTFGLTMRYLGMSLGMGVALGYCAAFGTLLPPVAKLFIPSIPCDETIVQIASTLPGQITLIGVLACLVGIGLAAMAGLSKEREMDESAKTEAVKEFNFPRGMAVATFSGVMSACFAFALTAAKPIGESSLLAGTDMIWTGLPKLVVVLLGGFTTNFLWCAYLHVRNGTAYQYLSGTVRDGHAALAGAVGEHGAVPRTPRRTATRGCRCSATMRSQPWPGRSGTCRSSSTRWARPRWAGSASPVGRSTWPASSSSARCGDGSSTNGRAPAKRPMPSSPWASAR